MPHNNLFVKLLLCLIVPAYHTMQANLKSDNGLAALRYWVMLSVVFLTELLLDQVDLSPGLTLIKLGFLFWCMAPFEKNGTYFIFEKVDFSNH